MIRYTVGFLFNSKLSKVLLIHKLHPEWQKGKINGIGGKFEDNESNQECIAREVAEETGLTISPDLWNKVAELHSSIFDVDVMTAVYEGSENDAKSIEIEQIEWFSVNNLPKNIISNLSWLIPICIDSIRNKNIENVVARIMVD